MKNILVIQGGGRLYCICVSAVFLDDFIEAEGFYRAFLLYRPRR